MLQPTLNLFRQHPRRRCRTNTEQPFKKSPHSSCRPSPLLGPLAQRRPYQWQPILIDFVHTCTTKIKPVFFLLNAALRESPVYGRLKGILVLNVVLPVPYLVPPKFWGSPKLEFGSKFCCFGVSFEFWSFGELRVLRVFESFESFRLI